MIMVASSVGTYLDVTQNAAIGSRSALTPTQTEHPEWMARAAQTLAAISDGAHTMGEVSARTGFSVADTLGTLGWLANADLIQLTGPADTPRADLTSAAIEALRHA
jgi:hypothetical protein